MQDCGLFGIGVIGGDIFQRRAQIIIGLNETLHCSLHGPRIIRYGQLRGHARGTLINEVERCSQLGIPYLVTHLGSHLGTGEKAGIKKLVEGLTRAGKTKNDVMILLENTAGQKNSVGSDFKQLGEIFKQLKPAKKFGVCFDTCHAFVAGYDLKTEEKVKETFAEFDEHIGIENLKILHLNDAKGEIGCNLDRHYHLGLGGIGEKGISAVVRFANKKKIPIILETPIDDDRDDFENIRKAKEFA